MKNLIRGTSLFLAFAIFFVSLSVPSYASELDDSNFINVLDYSTANNSGSNQVSMSSDSVAYFDLPFSYENGYVDFVVQFLFTVPTAAYAHSGGGRYSLTLVPLGNNFFRCFGTVGNFDSRIGVSFTMDGAAYVFFISFTAANYLTSYSMDALGSINDLPFLFANGSGTSVSIPSAPDYFVSGELIFPDWRKYDCIDLFLLLECPPLDAVSVTLGGVSVPFEMSYISRGDSSLSYYLSLHIDLSQLDRRSSNSPLLHFSVSSYVDSSFQIVSCDGRILVGYENLFTFWMRKVQASIGDFNSSVDTLFTTFWTNLSEILDLIEFRVLYGTNFLGSKLTSLIDGLADFKSSVGSWFSNIGTWIQNQTDTLGAKLDALINGTQAQQEAAQQAQQNAANLQGNVDNVSGQLSQVGNALDSVAKPEVNMSLDGFGVDYSSLTLLTAPLTQDRTIGSIMGIMAVLMLLSYVVFGKKG